MSDAHPELPTVPPPPQPDGETAIHVPHPDTAAPAAVPTGSPEAATAADTVGERFAVPGYEVLGELGRGGMGVVYRVRHQRLGRVVALKMVLHAQHAQAGELQRFLAEAEAVARLRHPNVVQLYECGTHDGLPYFTLEYIAGGSLADKLREQPLKPADAARLVQQIARGVQHAHEQGIIHRDLKPANVLLEPDGTPRVTDFGLARRVESGGRPSFVFFAAATCQPNLSSYNNSLPLFRHRLNADASPTTDRTGARL